MFHLAFPDIVKSHETLGGISAGSIEVRADNAKVTALLRPIRSPDKEVDVLGTDVAVVLFFGAQILFVLSAVIFAVSAVDDLFIDLYFFLHSLLKKHSFDENPCANQNLGGAEKERHIAIMLPAWQEHDVIERSVSNLIQSLDYRNYQVFIGTYPNDVRTRREVERLAARFDKVHQVVTGLPGPTCKADCLNNIINFILDFECRRATVFSGFVLQDAEDIVHPSSLTIFNGYLRHFDLVQIPVYSLKRKWNNLTGGHYMDEFAEFQNKEIRVREHLAKLVPGAGVGTAYSRRAILTACADGEVFNTNSLTEDYEFSLRLHEAGFHQVFARVANQKELDGVDSSSIEKRFRHNASLHIATREFFPSRFWAAVRQKTRWTIGISLQGWRNFKWRGNWRIRYFLWRDRKMLFFSQAIAAGFFSLTLFAAVNGYHWIQSDGYRFAPLLTADSRLWHLVHFNLVILAGRILQRCYWTFRLYGWSCVVLVPVRYIWGALINYLAVTRALKIFLTHLVTGQKIGWDKTAHDYPDNTHCPAQTPAAQNACQNQPIEPPEKTRGVGRIGMRVAS